MTSASRPITVSRLYFLFGRCVSRIEQILKVFLCPQFRAHSVGRKLPPLPDVSGRITSTLRDKRFCSFASPNSCHSHIFAYEPLPRVWSHPNTTRITGGSQEKLKLYLQTFWASRIGSRRGVSLSLLHLCTVHMLSEDWKWQKKREI